VLAWFGFSCTFAGRRPYVTVTGKENHNGKDQIYMKRLEVKVKPGVGGFAEDKDEAKRLRVETILPALNAGSIVVLDFGDVKFSTQSFVHALVGEVLQRFKESALEKLEFRSCSPQLKSLVQLVVDYSLGGFSTEGVLKGGPKQNGATSQRNQERDTGATPQRKTTRPVRRT
jgi:uncharacterized protein DUF4325